MILFGALLTACRPAAEGGLLFASARSGNWEIWLQAPGKPAVNLTRYPSSDRFADWSPDRRQLVFASDRAGSFDLYLIEPDGGNLRVLDQSPYPETTPRWSRQGTIVFVSEREDRNEELYTIRPDGKELQRLTKDPAPDYDPAWLPDGKAIVFVSQRSGAPELWRQPLDGGAPVQLTHDTSDKRSPDVSPDGKRVVYAQRQGADWQLMTLELGTGQPQVLTRLKGWAGLPRWLGADKLLFASGAVRHYSLWSLTPGGAPEKVDAGPDTREAVWQADRPLR